MIHDLTANSDFQAKENLHFFGVYEKTISEFNDLTSPYDEVVLTGTSLDREHKRYILDCESEQKNMCDCCGSPIKIKPWDFEDNKTLCSECEKVLEEMHNLRENGGLLEKIIDDNFTVRVDKPWDIEIFERENAINNVLLWD